MRLLVVKFGALADTNFAGGKVLPLLVGEFCMLTPKGKSFLFWKTYPTPASAVLASAHLPPPPAHPPAGESSFSSWPLTGLWPAFSRPLTGL